MNLSFLPGPELRNILSWVLPPLVGAAIGYITNAIAIRMLFRPLKEWRVLGVRIPLTPGIIPRQRSQLAESIGRMVSRELLTEEAVRRQLMSEGFQGRLEENIHSLLGDLLHRPLARLARAENQELVLGTVQKFLSETLYSFFSSKSFVHGVRTIVTRLVQSLGSRTLREVVGNANVGSFLAGRLLPLLSTPEMRERIASALGRWLSERRASEESLGKLLPKELAQVLAELLATFLPSLFDSLFRWLDQEQTRADLTRRGKRLLRDILERLNVLQRFLISAGQFDRTLEQQMPSIVDDALRQAREYVYDPETLVRLRDVLGTALEGWRGRPAGEVLSRIDTGSVAGLVERALARLEDEGLRERIAEGLQRLVGRMSGRSMAELAMSYLQLSEQEVVDFACLHILNYLSRKETSEAIASEVIAFSRRFIEEHEDSSLAELFRVEPPLQARAASYLTDQLIRIIDARLPAFIESFDVRQLVVEKINNLDVAQVEQLLLMVIAKHLKWINLFGGLLGAIIGFSQLVLRLLR
jgi:uncharacterized membrane protein YheB (UPF0754 family)